MTFELEESGIGRRDSGLATRDSRLHYEVKYLPRYDVGSGLQQFISGHGNNLHTTAKSDGTRLQLEITRGKKEYLEIHGEEHMHLWRP